MPSAVQLGTHELAVPVVTDSGDHGGRHPEPRQADANVAGESAEEAPEGIDVCQRSLALERVEVGVQPADDNGLNATGRRWRGSPTRRACQASPVSHAAGFRTMIAARSSAETPSSLSRGRATRETNATRSGFTFTCVA